MWVGCSTNSAHWKFVHVRGSYIVVITLLLKCFRAVMVRPIWMLHIIKISLNKLFVVSIRPIWKFIRKFDPVIELSAACKKLYKSLKLHSFCLQTLYRKCAFYDTNHCKFKRFFHSNHPNDCTYFYQSDIQAFAVLLSHVKCMGFYNNPIIIYEIVECPKYVLIWQPYLFAW